jgi:hypothetical protein
MITIEQLPEQNIADKVIYVLNKVEPKFHILFGSVSKNVQKMKKKRVFFLIWLRAAILIFHQCYFNFLSISTP